MRLVWQGFVMFLASLGMVVFTIWLAMSEDASDDIRKCEQVNDGPKLMQCGSYHKIHSQMKDLTVNAP